MRLAYLGTPEIAVRPLIALHDAGHELVTVVSAEDKRRGRGRGVQPSPVKAAATERGIPVTESVDDLLDHELDLGVVVAFGHIIRPHVLAHVDLVNVHFSLLPRWRGAAPVERAILAGDAETGVCLMQLEEELDTGGVYRRETLSIGPNETAAELRTRLVDAAVPMLVDALEDGLGAAEPQVGDPTYAHKLDRDDLHLDFEQPAEQLRRVVRVGGAWTTLDGDVFKIWDVAVVSGAGLDPGHLRDRTVGTGSGALRLEVVQPAGKPRMDAAAWRNGVRLPDDARMGT